MSVYDGHNAMVRQFVADRPSLTYVEAKLEAPETGTILAEATGIDMACWKQCKPQERKCVENREAEGNVEEPITGQQSQQKRKQQMDRQKKAR